MNTKQLNSTIQDITALNDKFLAVYYPNLSKKVDVLYLIDQSVETLQNFAQLADISNNRFLTIDEIKNLKISDESVSIDKFEIDKLKISNRKQMLLSQKWVVYYEQFTYGNLKYAKTLNFLSFARCGEIIYKKIDIKGDINEIVKICNSDNFAVFFNETEMQIYNCDGELVRTIVAELNVHMKTVFMCSKANGDFLLFDYPGDNGRRLIIIDSLGMHEFVFENQRPKELIAQLPFGFLMRHKDEELILHAYNEDMEHLGALFTEPFSKIVYMGRDVYAILLGSKIKIFKYKSKNKIKKRCNFD